MLRVCGKEVGKMEVVERVGVCGSKCIDRIGENWWEIEEGCE